MSRIKISLFLLLTFLLIPGTTSYAAPLAAPSPYDVIAAVNALRASHGLPPYAVDPILMMAAQTQADYLASTPNSDNGHIGPGGTDANARAKALGFPFPTGLDINENWGMLHEDESVQSLITGQWSDPEHMHTMLHDRGQLVGAGVGISGDSAYIILDVAAYWGDAGLTPQPTTSAYGENSATQYAVSQYIAPVKIATPSKDGSITHTVMSGQSLWMIADKYKVDVERLRQLNNLGTIDTIYIGQKILIQLPQTPTPTKEVTVAPFSTSSAAIATPRVTLPPTSVRVTTATVKNTTANSPRNDTIWFMVFFALFGAGVILVILSQSARK
jgi:LysM repeat protein